MKILELRFKNLNSLYGEWHIDFTAPDYETNGIFALSGPTGAGKSTILDAICLALYGATPRLGRITAKENNIISRQTGECYAEVVIETGSGAYRCRWSQRRSRKKAEGNLQSPDHEISDAVTQEILASQLNPVKVAVESYTGMNFDRFTRSVLLAQGSFDAFLKAGIGEKSDILEQITGTEIYSEISIKVAERRKTESEKLELLKAKLSGIKILTPEEVDTLQLQNEKDKEQLFTTNKQKKAVDEGLSWHVNLEKIQKDIVSFEKDAEALKRQEEAFNVKDAILDRALKAHHIEADFKAFDLLRAQQKKDEKDLLEAQNNLPIFQHKHEESQEKLTAAVLIASQAKEGLEQAEPKIRQARLLDQELQHQNTEIARVKKEFDLETKNLSTHAADLKKTQEELRQARNEQNNIQTYLKVHQHDEKLMSSYAAFEMQVDAIHKLQNQKTTLAGQVKSEGESLRDAQEAINRMQDKLSKDQEILSTFEAQLEKDKEKLAVLLNGRYEREYKDKLESLQTEKGLREKIASLETHRAALEDGKECPLCGAKEHPYAMGNIPQLDEITVRIQEIIALLKNIDQAKEALEKTKESLVKAKEAVLKSHNQKDDAIEKCKRITEKQESFMQQLEENNLELITKRDSFLAEIKRLDFEYSENESLKNLLVKLKERLEAWKTASKNAVSLDIKIAGLEKTEEGQNATFTAMTENLETIKKNQTKLIEQRDQKIEARKKIFGDLNPDSEEKKLKDNIANADAQVEGAREKRDEANALFAKRTNEIAHLSENIQTRAESLKEKETVFLSKLEQENFATETEFLTACLRSEERENLQNEKQNLKEKRLALDTNLTDRHTALKGLQKNAVTDQSKEDLAEEDVRLNVLIDELNTKITQTEFQLKENQNALSAVAGQQKEIDQQAQELTRWDKLKTLIGSADGKNYRTFAQGLTFQIMVSHANQQLQKMTDRYLLLRDEKEPLSLNVIDNYQAGEVRPTKNLSGGESFIMSLALALGLSKMASQKIRVDSLFLDEGFGTLDEDSLEIALDTLSNLYQDGKLIGIISHVTALKERIQTQINIVPQSGGRSEIVGPGCHLVDHV